MIYMLLAFLPMFVTLGIVTRVQLSRKANTAALAILLLELFVFLDYYSLEQWAMGGVAQSRPFLLIVAVTYSLITPLFYVFICECIHNNWKTERTVGMVLLGVLNVFPSIVISLDGEPVMTPTHYLYTTVVLGGDVVVDMRNKDLVMVMQLVWLLYLHVRYFRWMLKKDYHFTIQSKTFYMTLVFFVCVALLANLVPNGYWKIPVFIWGYFLFVSASFTAVNIMIVRGLMDNPIHDANNEPIIETIVEDTGSLGARVVNIIKERRLYTNQNLQLADVTRLVGSNRSYVSKALHEVTGLNFNTFLNKLRTEEALRILREDKEMKLEAVADLCGFSSASIFTRVFKKEMGMTPSQARMG